MKENKNRIPLRSPPQKGLFLNKPLIIMVCAVIVLVLFFGVFYAFRAPQKKITDKHIASPADLQVTDNTHMQKLPNNYQDVQGIRHFLKQSEKQQKIKKKVAPTAPVASLHNQNSKNLTEALQSNVFFNGLVPKKQIGKTTTSQAFNNKDNTSSNKGGDKESAYDQQNMQEQKLKFLQTKENPGDIYNVHPLIKPLSPYEIQAGAILPAVIVTAINTSLPGMVVAQVTQDVYDTVTGKHLLIPKGSKIIGKYDSRIAYGQTRVLIAFNRVIMPNGSSIQLNNFNGSDMGGTAGFDGKVNNHWMRILGAATISTLLSVGTGVASTNAYYNDNNYYPSPMQNALSSAGSDIASTGQQLTSRAMNIQPTITVPAGFEFNVMVNKDMVLEPYQVRHATL